MAARPLLITADQFDGVLRQLDPLLSAEQRQQNENALVGSLAGIEPELPRERTVQYTHVVARLQPGALGQLDQPVALARAEIIDNLVGNACRLDAIHDQTDDAEAPTGGVPLRLDGEETVTRKERRPDLDLASM